MTFPAINTAVPMSQPETRLQRFKASSRFRFTNLKYALRNHPTDVMEYWQSLELFLAGLWLMMPFASFAMFPAYRWVGELASEAQVGGVLIAVAFWSLWSTAGLNMQQQRWSCTARAFIFGLLAWLVFYLDFRLLSGPLFVGMAANSLWCLRRLSR